MCLSRLTGVSMKNILIALVLALGSVTVQAVPAAPATVNVDGTAVPLRITSTLAEDVLDAEKAVARARLDFIPGAGETFHFDANGQKSAKPVKGGFFRKVVGTTADGRIVVQDFWQDSGKAKLEPYAVAKGAAASDFSVTVDSALIGYTDDDTFAIQPVRNQKLTGRYSYYNKGRLRAQLPLRQEDGESENDLPELRAFATTHIRLFYPDGKLLVLFPVDLKNLDVEGIVLVYRADGTLLASTTTGAEQWIMRDTAGSVLTKETAEYAAAAEEFQEVARQWLALARQLEQFGLDIRYGDKN